MFILLAAAVVLATIPTYRNYRAYMDVGAGGLPHNVVGWLIATSLKPFGREQITTEMYDLDPDQESWLAVDEKLSQGKSNGRTDAEGPVALPLRKGPRPPTSWHSVPHRQLADTSPQPIRMKMVENLRRLARQNPGRVALDLSPHERLHHALVLDPGWPSPHATADAALREIAHVHEGSDGSLHVVLAPADCKLVIRQGWGQRHPLSHARLLWGTKLFLPKEYLLVYAPRDEEEVQVVTDIVRAAAGYMTGSKDIKY